MTKKRNLEYFRPVPDERVVVHRDKQSGDELAIHPIRHPTVPRNDRVEVLDPVRALYCRSPEATEGGNHRREPGHEQRVELDGSHSQAHKSRRQLKEEKCLQKRPYALRLRFVSNGFGSFCTFWGEGKGGYVCKWLPTSMKAGKHDCGWVLEYRSVERKWGWDERDGKKLVRFSRRLSHSFYYNKHTCMVAK